MGIIGKLFGKKEDQVPLDVPCPHTALTARWDRLEDMGKEDRVSTYLCTACGSTFTPEQARGISVPRV